MKERSSSVVGLWFLLMMGFSGQVGAFSESDLEKLKATESCKFCDLTGANLNQTILRGAQLEGADLTGANLTGANLTRADLTGTIFCETKMPDGTKNNSGC